MRLTNDRQQLIWEFILRGVYRSYGMDLDTSVHFYLPKSQASCDLDAPPSTAPTFLQRSMWYLSVESHSVVAWAEDPHNYAVLQQVSDGITDRSKSYSPLKFALWISKQAELAEQQPDQETT